MYEFLDKATEKWWPKFLVTEPEIDVNKLDGSRDCSEFSEESQVTLDKTKFEPGKKLRCRISPESIGRSAKLRRAWNQASKFDSSRVHFRK